jgi:hypothetical protein
MLSPMVTRATPPDTPPPTRGVVVAPPAHLLNVPDRLEAAYWLMERVPTMPAVSALFAATRLYRAVWLAQLVAAAGGFTWLSASPQGLLPGATVGLATLGATNGVRRGATARRCPMSAAPHGHSAPRACGDARR